MIGSPFVAYRIVAQNSYGLKRISPTYTIPASGSASVAQESTSELSPIFPNPTLDLLTIKEGSIVRVLSLTGVEMLVADDSATSLNVSSLAAGAYIAEVRGADGQVRA